MTLAYIRLSYVRGHRRGLCPDGEHVSAVSTIAGERRAVEDAALLLRLDRRQHVQVVLLPEPAPSSPQLDLWSR